MPSLLDIRRRIRSVKNTQQLTKAMKMVSAAKLRRAQERVMSARPYANQLKSVLGSLAGKLENVEHPLLQVRPEQKILAIVVTADRGLCGGFNSNTIIVMIMAITPSLNALSRSVLMALFYQYCSPLRFFAAASIRRIKSVLASA